MLWHRPPPSPRPTFFALTAALAGFFGAAFVSLSNARAQEVADNATILPFHFTASEDVLVDVSGRRAATQRPEMETVADDSQGVALATMRARTHYRMADYDWRKCEVSRNALPQQFVTGIDGLAIHFVHVCPKHANVMSAIVGPGWPGSVSEQIKIIGTLLDATARCGKPESAFDVVVPLLAGYGFSGKPIAPSSVPPSIARAWTVLMKPLRYRTSVAQRHDWRSATLEQMGLQAPPESLGVSTNMGATLPAEMSNAMKDGRRLPVALPADERRARNQLDGFCKKNVGYAGATVDHAQMRHPIAACVFTRAWSFYGTL